MSDQPAAMPTPSPEPAAPAEPSVNDPAPGTFAEPAAQPAAQPAAPTPTPAAAQPEPTPAQPGTPPPDPTAEPGADPTDRVVPAADGYQLPEGVPPEIGTFANQHGFTQEQLNATIQHFGGIMQHQQQQQRTALQQLGEAHLKNWGENAEYNLNLAKRALSQNDPDGSLRQALNDSGYGNHPAVLEFLFNLGKGMQEGGFLKSAVHRPKGEKTAAQAMYGDNHPSNG